MKLTKDAIRSLIQEELGTLTEAMDSKELAGRAATFVDDLLEQGANEGSIKSAVNDAINLKRKQKQQAQAGAANRRDIQEMGCGDQPQMPDPTHHDEDHEGSMAKRQMFKTAEYAAIIFDMLHDDEELPAWIQSKLTKIADYVGVVKHYLEYDKVIDGHPANRKEKKWSDADHDRQEDLAQKLAKKNPDMPKDEKMAIAGAQLNRDKRKRSKK